MSRHPVTPMDEADLAVAAPGGHGPIAVVSGSRSPTTERQIRHAVNNGFEGTRVDPSALVTRAKATIRSAPSKRQPSSSDPQRKSE